MISSDPTIVSIENTYTARRHWAGDGSVGSACLAGWFERISAILQARIPAMTVIVATAIQNKSVTLKENSGRSSKTAGIDQPIISERESSLSACWRMLRPGDWGSDRAD